MAKEEHERLMQEEREDSCTATDYARDGDRPRGATVTEATPAREAERLEGPFNSAAS